MYEFQVHGLVQPVIPAEAGIQGLLVEVDSRFRGNDGLRGSDGFRGNDGFRGSNGLSRATHRSNSSRPGTSLGSFRRASESGILPCSEGWANARSGEEEPNGNALVMTFVSGT